MPDCSEICSLGFSGEVQQHGHLQVLGVRVSRMGSTGFKGEVQQDGFYRF